MRLTEKQREIIEAPVGGTIFLRGPAGAGKTTVGVRRLRHLIESGVSAHSILVLVPQKRLALPYLAEVRNPRRKAGAEATIATLGSLAFQMVNLFWPLAAKEQQLSQRDPYRRPVFLTLELVQYLMFKLLDPEIQRNDRFASVRIGQTRLFSQIADNLNKASLVGFPRTEIAGRLKEALPGDSEREHIYEDAQVCANLFHDYCLDRNLLDFSLQVKLFVDHLWRQEVPRAFLQRRYTHLIVDNLEEDTPVTHDVLRDWLPRCRSALLMMDEELSVCELCFAVDCAQPKVSRHLAKMRQYKLLSVRRDGVWMYYRVNPQLPAWAFKIVQQMTQAGECAQLLVRDRNRLAAMPDRPLREQHQVYATASVTPLQSRLPGAPIEAGVRIVR